MSDQGASATVCESCGYDLAGLPNGAPCPECGAAVRSSLEEAFTRLDARRTGRLATGFALIAISALGAAASLVLPLGLMLLDLSVSGSRGWPMRSRPLWIAFDILLAATLATWSLGWWLASAAPADPATRSARRTARHASPMVFVVGAVAIFEWLWGPALGHSRTLAAVTTLCAVVLMVAHALASAMVLGDLATLVGEKQVRRRATRTATTLAVSALILVVGAPLLTVSLLHVLPVPFVLLYALGIRGYSVIASVLLAFILVLAVQVHRQIAVLAMRHLAAAYQTRAQRDHWVVAAGLARILTFGSPEPTEANRPKGRTETPQGAG